jgi:hypothetical protein
MVDAEGSSPLSALFSLSCACTTDVASSLVDYSALPLYVSACGARCGGLHWWDSTEDLQRAEMFVVRHNRERIIPAFFWKQFPLHSERDHFRFLLLMRRLITTSCVHHEYGKRNLLSFPFPYPKCDRHESDLCWSKRKTDQTVSSANGAKTDQTVRFFVWGRVTVLGSKVGTVLVARTQGPDLVKSESEHIGTR